MLSASEPTQSYIIYSNAKLGRVRAVDVTTTDDVMSPIVNAWRPVAVDYDLAPADGPEASDVIYYSDTARGVINKRDVSGGGITEVISGGSSFLHQHRVPDGSFKPWHDCVFRNWQL